MSVFGPSFLDRRIGLCRCGTEAFLRHRTAEHFLGRDWPEQWRVVCESPICHACTGTCATEAEALDRWARLQAPMVVA